MLFTAIITQPQEILNRFHKQSFQIDRENFWPNIGSILSRCHYHLLLARGKDVVNCNFCDTAVAINLNIVSVFVISTQSQKVSNQFQKLRLEINVISP